MNLNNEVLVFCADAGGENAQNTGGGKVFFGKATKLPETGRERAILLVLKIHIIAGGLVVLRVGRVGVAQGQGPGAVVGVEEMSLEAIVVMPEGEPTEIEDVSDSLGVG